MTYLNGKHLLSIFSGGAIVDVPSEQATVVIVVNALTNINGRVFQNYTAALTTIGGYQAYQIKYNNAVLTEEQAATYMRYMTGSTFVPKYNFDFPRNSLFIFADYTIWKPQFDSTNGLVLFAMGKLANANNYVTLTQAEYDALTTKDPNTYYFIEEE